jgi:negative regulator of sigma E activity
MTTGLNPPESPTDFDRVNLRQESERERHFHCEQLSAMMDGTLSTDEGRFLLRRMQHDAELAGCWERWQLYGDAMRGQTASALPADFSRRVARAIAAEAEADRAAHSATFEPVAATGGATAAWRQRLRWGGGAALAASVAIAALISTRDLTQPSNVMPPTAIASAPSTTAPATISTPTASPALSTPQAFAVSPPPLVLSPDEIPKKMANIAAVSSSDTAVHNSESAQLAQASAVQVASANPARGSSLHTSRHMRPSSRAAAVHQLRPVALAAQPRAVTDATTDPFGRQTLDLSAKPWPRALLPESAAVGSVTVDYSVGSLGVHPSFQPRAEAAHAPSSAGTDSVPVSGESPAP